MLKIGNKLQRKATTKERIIEAMTCVNKKQIDISRETGIYKGTISNYIKGKYEPKPDAVAKIAKSLNVSEMWLMGYDVPMRRPYDYSRLEEGPQGCMEQITESPYEEDMMLYYETLDPDEQRDVLQYVKDYANGKLKANSPGEQALSEGEKALLALFRMVPEERQQLVLQMIKAALDNLK